MSNFPEDTSAIPSESKSKSKSSCNAQTSSNSVHPTATALNDLFASSEYLTSLTSNCQQHYKYCDTPRPSSSSEIHHQEYYFVPAPEIVRDPSQVGLPSSDGRTVIHNGKDKLNDVPSIVQFSNNSKFLKPSQITTDLKSHHHRHSSPLTPCQEQEEVLVNTNFSFESNCTTLPGLAEIDSTESSFSFDSSSGNNNTNYTLGHNAQQQVDLLEGRLSSEVEDSNTKAYYNENVAAVTPESKVQNNNKLRSSARICPLSSVADLLNNNPEFTQTEFLSPTNRSSATFHQKYSNSFQLKQRPRSIRHQGRSKSTNSTSSSNSNLIQRPRSLIQQGRSKSSNSTATLRKGLKKSQIATMMETKNTVVSPKPNNSRMGSPRPNLLAHKSKTTGSMTKLQEHDKAKNGRTAQYNTAGGSSPAPVPIVPFTQSMTPNNNPVSAAIAGGWANGSSPSMSPIPANVQPPVTMSRMTSAPPLTHNNNNSNSHHHRRVVTMDAGSLLNQQSQQQQHNRSNSQQSYRPSTTPTHSATQQKQQYQHNSSNSFSGNPFDDPVILEDLMSTSIPIVNTKSYEGTSTTTSNFGTESHSSSQNQMQFSNIPHPLQSRPTKVGGGGGNNYGIMNRAASTGTTSTRPSTGNSTLSSMSGATYLKAFDPLQHSSPTPHNHIHINTPSSSTPTQQHYNQNQSSHKPDIAAAMQSHPLSLDKSELSKVAAELASLKPRVNTEAEEAQLAQENHRITLGNLPHESTGTLGQKPSLAKKLTTAVLSAGGAGGTYSGKGEDTTGIAGAKVKAGSGGETSMSSSTKIMASQHQSAKSLGVEDLGGMINEINDVGGGKGLSHRRSASHQVMRSEFSMRAVFGLGGAPGANTAGTANNSSGTNPEKDDSRPVTPTRPSRKTRTVSSSPRRSPKTGMTNDLTVSSRSVLPSPERSVTSSPNSRTSKSPSRRLKFKMRSSSTSQPPVMNIEASDSVDEAALQLNLQLKSSAVSTTPEIKIRTSEQDPSPHQMQIPHHSEALFHANLCHLFSQYRQVDQNFDFRSLVGMTRNTMEVFVNGKQRGDSLDANSGIDATPNSDSPPSHLLNNIMQTTVTAPVTSDSENLTSLQHLMDVHKPIIAKLLKCEKDLVVEGFFHEIGDECQYDTLTTEISTMDRMEVAILKSDLNRKFFVVYQGSADLQIKPVRNKDQKAGSTSRFGKNNVETEKNVFSDEQPVAVFPPFRKAYFPKHDLESKVFAKLDKLAETHPFFDVTITGHSFGAVLAQLASMRYACSRPMMMVSCFTFGCPKIGALNYRYHVNSLPNLKMMRFEYGSDPWIYAPENPTWVHAGHAIVIASHTAKNTNVTKGNKSEKGSSKNDDSSSNKSDKVMLQDPVRAYRFGDSRPVPGGGVGGPSGKFMNTLLAKHGTQKEKQIDHDITSYIKAIERIPKMGLPWPTHFVGEVGAGVSGLNDEKRNVV